MTTTSSPLSPGPTLATAAIGRWLPWGCGVVAAGIAAKNVVGAHSDLSIYLDAARELVAGNVNLYRERPGEGALAYPAFAVLPFVMLLTVFGDTGARVIWCLLLGLTTTWLLRATVAAMAPLGGLRWWQWLVFGLLFQRSIAQNLTHGQLSLLVGAMVTAGAVSLLRARDHCAGVLLGLAAAMKLTPLLFVAALPLMRRGKAAATMAATFVLAVFVVPWPLVGTDEHFRHLGEFWRAISAASLTPETSALGRAVGANIDGTLPFLLQPRPVDPEGRTVNLLDVGDGTLLMARIVWSLGVGGMLLAWFLAVRRRPDAERLANQCGAVVMALSLFSPMLRVYHLTAAFLAFALFCRGPAHRRDLTWYAIAAVLLFTLTLRQRRLLGEAAWRALETGGYLHFALVGMIAWLLRNSAASRASRPMA